MTTSAVALDRVVGAACAAQRYNGGYVKDLHTISTNQVSNKTIIKVILGITPAWDALDSVVWEVQHADLELAAEITRFYRRLIFSAISSENEFNTKLYQILSKDTVELNEFGFIACLPHVYRKDRIKNMLKSLDQDRTTPTPGSTILDRDCEVLDVRYSERFAAYNVTAIIDNKLVSWMNKQAPNLGACVVVSARVKENSSSWEYKVSVTRLNYVKIFQ